MAVDCSRGAQLSKRVAMVLMGPTRCRGDAGRWQTPIETSAADYGEGSHQNLSLAFRFAIRNLFEISFWLQKHRLS